MHFIRVQAGDQEWRINESAIACVIQFPPCNGCVRVRIRFIGGGEPLDIESLSAEEAAALVDELAQNSYSHSRSGADPGRPFQMG